MYIKECNNSSMMHYSSTDIVDDRPPLPPRGPFMNLYPKQKPQLDGYGPYSQVPAPKPVANATAVTPPPYRMPPYPLPPLPSGVNESGAAAASGVSYHTHSSKFPIEREVVLNSSEKNHKIPILSEYNKRQRATVAPEGPVKQQAWTESSQQFPESSYTPYQGFSARQSLTDIERCGPPRDDKTKITKTYYTIKDMISNRFSKSKESVDEQTHMNNQPVDNMTTSMQGMALASRPVGRPIPPLPVIRSPQAHPNFPPGSEMLSPVQPSPPLSVQQQQRRIMQQQAMSSEIYATARACLVQTRPPAQRRPVQRIPGPSSELSVSSPNLTANLEQNGVYISKTPMKYPPRREDSDTNDDGGFKTRFHPPEDPRDKENEESMEKEERKEDVSGAGEKVSSAPSSDYEKATRGSSVGDSGRGSAAYSSGRPGSVDLPNAREPPPIDSPASNACPPVDDSQSTNRSKEWVDMVESELRQILDPKHQTGACSSTLSDSVSSLTPPLPPLSPGGGSSPTPTPRHMRFKHSSLPYGSKPDYEKDIKYSKGQRGVTQRRDWSRPIKGGEKSRGNASGATSRSSKMGLGLDTDLGSTTTGPLDSVLDSRLSLHTSDEDLSTTIDTNDALAIRRQLQGLENMYSEVLKLLGVKKQKYPMSDSRSKKRYGSMSSLPSSVSSRPVRDKRREDRKRVRDIKGINKRFQRLESHVVTLARSVAHLSSEMRTQHLMIQEMESIRGEMAALRAQTTAAARSQSVPRALNSMLASPGGASGVDAKDPSPLTNPQRVKKLTKFFGDEPPLLRLFLRRLGYEKYASLFDKEKIGMVELPYLTEERLQKMGIPLGPRLRILQEAQISFCRDTVYVV